MYNVEIYLRTGTLALYLYLKNENTNGEVFFLLRKYKCAVIRTQQNRFMSIIAAILNSGIKIIMQF